MHDLAAAGRMTDVNGVLQIEMRRQSRKVVGIVIHVMAVAGLAGPAVAATVMGDDSIAMTEEEQHLRVPIIGRQRPAVAKHYGLTLAPVLVEVVLIASERNALNSHSKSILLGRGDGLPEILDLRIAVRPSLK